MQNNMPYLEPVQIPSKSIYISKFVHWIDEYYSEKVFASRPFHEALDYAFVFSQQKGTTMTEKIESLLGEIEESGGLKKIQDD